MERNNSLNHAWCAIRAFLNDHYSFNNIKNIAGRAGIDITKFSHLVQRSVRGNTKGELLSALDGEIHLLFHKEKYRVLTRFAEIIAEENVNGASTFDEDLDNLGWKFVEGKLVPINLFDIAELEELPKSASVDLVKAVSRIRNGDLDGALASACAAVDSAVQKIYQEYELQRQPNDGFQRSYGTALGVRGTLTNIKLELISLGWNEEDANRLVDNLKGSLNQGANVMQTLRSRMSDVHGSKTVLEPLVFDSIKWASLILRMLK